MRSGQTKLGHSSKSWTERCRSEATNNGKLLYQFGLDRRYGRNGVEKDSARARDFFEWAVELGHVNAMYNLGSIYFHGAAGVEEDIARARELFERAAENGNYCAMFELAYILHRGLGKKSDGDALQAKRLYEKAMANGEEKSIVNLGNLLETGAPGVPKEEARALQLYDIASARHDGFGSYNLGRVYEYGLLGRKVNLKMAHFFYSKASKEGNSLGREKDSQFYLRRPARRRDLHEERFQDPDETENDVNTEVLKQNVRKQENVGHSGEATGESNDNAILINRLRMVENYINEMEP